MEKSRKRERILIEWKDTLSCNSHRTNSLSSMKGGNSTYHMHKHLLSPFRVASMQMILGLTT